MLAEIVDLTAAHDIDAVLIAGDLFDSTSPTPESEEIVWSTLLELAEQCAHVVVVAGNHDSGHRLRAVTPLLDLAGVTVIAEPTPPGAGGATRVSVGDGELRLALLPFVSQRGIIRADALMSDAAFEHAGTYADRMHSLIDLLCRDFADDAVNVVVAHALVLGGMPGGGERPGHLIGEYAIPASSFPPSATYVALGHLHGSQTIPGPTSIHYCGSPLHLDFGDTDEHKNVHLIEADPGLPAVVRRLRLRSGRRLTTVRGSLDEIAGLDPGDDWLRVIVAESMRVDLAEEVRRLLGDNVLDVMVDRPAGSDDDGTAPRSQMGRNPTELFDAYLASSGIDDDRLRQLFRELLAERAS